MNEQNIQSIYGFNGDDFLSKKASVLVSVIRNGLKEAKMYTYNMQNYENVGFEIRPRLLVYKSVKAFKKEFQ